MTFELGWNVLKDFLEYEGFETLKSPRESLKKAFEVDLIADGHKWLQALKDRNLTSHTYDEVLAKKVVAQIVNEYYPLLLNLYLTMKQRL